jgi:hypothetical protein
MKKYFFALVAVEFLVGLAIVIVFSICITGCSVTSHVETAAGVNFNSYKTFGWVNVNGEKKEDSADNDIVDNNIKNAITLQLENKGWKETNQNPDVILDYNVMVEQKVRQASERVYNYPFTNYYYNRWHHNRGYIYYPYNLRDFIPITFPSSKVL